MLIVRFRRTFKERSPEWAMAFIMFGWGIEFALPGSALARPFFALLRQMMDEEIWASILIIGGSLRLAALYVNGSRRETPHVRAAGSLLGCWFWALLTVNAATVPYRNPAVFTYAGLFILEAIMLSYALKDAMVAKDIMRDGSR